MAVQTFDALAPASATHRRRIRVALVASLVAFAVAAIAAADAATPDQRVLQVGTGAGTSAPDTPDAAVQQWVEDHRDQLFAAGDAPLPYVGRCDDVAPADGAPGLCSAMAEDLGAAQIHVAGIHASDVGADVLVEETDLGWQVTAVEAWPALADGTRYDGAPWSPTTAITTWWRDDERAVAMYGEGTDHLRSCHEATAAMTATGQPLLCSTLVEDAGTTRVYDSGMAGHPADVRLTLEQQPDRSWAIAETLAR